MIITVLGANGKTGIEVVKQALAAGHTVNGLVRQSDGSESSSNYNVIVGDATNPQDVAKASKNSDVIISTLGTMSNKTTLMTDAVKAVIAASKTTGRKRFILMSSSAVETERLKGFMKLTTGMMKGLFDDKSTSEGILRTSSLDWTIVHATRLTKQPKGSGLRVLPQTEKIGMKHKIARADVAAFMVKEAEENAYIKREVTISK